MIFHLLYSSKLDKTIKSGCTYLSTNITLCTLCNPFK